MISWMKRKKVEDAYDEVENGIAEVLDAAKAVEKARDESGAVEKSPTAIWIEDLTKLHAHFSHQLHMAETTLAKAQIRIDEYEKLVISTEKAVEIVDGKMETVEDTTPKPFKPNPEAHRIRSDDNADTPKWPLTDQFPTND